MTGAFSNFATRTGWLFSGGNSTEPLLTVALVTSAGALGPDSGVCDGEAEGVGVGRESAALVIEKLPATKASMKRMRVRLAMGMTLVVIIFSE
jgi:hypothetical protein